MVLAQLTSNGASEIKNRFDSIYPCLLSAPPG